MAGRRFPPSLRAPSAVVQSIPRTNIKVMNAADAELDIAEYLKVFFGESPESIGNRLPDEKFIVK